MRRCWWLARPDRPVLPRPRSWTVLREVQPASSLSGCNPRAATSFRSRQRRVSASERTLQSDSRAVSLGSLSFLCPASKLMEEPFRIQVINLLQHSVRQFHPVYFPPPLSGISPIVKIFICCFQPAKVVSVHFFVHAIVGAEHDPVLILQEKLARPARLPA